jgi:hypothetical protein
VRSLTVGSLVAVATFAVSCTTPKLDPVSENASRGTASDTQGTREEPTLRYYTYADQKKQLRDAVDIIAADRWMNFRPGGRTSFLEKFYFSNVRARSNRGLRHASCFTGNAKDVEARFFANGTTFGQVVNDGQKPVVKVAEDGMQMSFDLTIAQGTGEQRRIFFRLANCNSGKNPIGNPDAVVKQIVVIDKQPAKFEPVAPKAQRSVASGTISENGFGMEDQPDASAPSTVPRFVMKTDFDKASEKAGDRPWRGLDVSTPVGAYKFAVLMQKYAYEGMFIGGARQPDWNLIAQANKERYWCHMPWLQPGDKGREWVHGMTREFDLRPSPYVDAYKNTPPGSNWGVAYYNASGCTTIGRVFGADAAIKANPDFSNRSVQFDDGTVTVKFLFTQAPVSGLDEAFSWTANVSGPGETKRSLQKVKHVQMDIAIKDASLKSPNRDYNGWIMLTYYFDPTFAADAEWSRYSDQLNPIRTIANMPPGFLKMRPMGIVTGVGAPVRASGADAKWAEFVGDTIIFKGAQTNEATNRLNGPADNPKASCFGCHATAGTEVKAVPGIMEMSVWKQHQNAGQAMDFSQQMSHAKEHFQTRPE